MKNTILDVLVLIALVVATLVWTGAGIYSIGTAWLVSSTITYFIIDVLIVSVATIACYALVFPLIIQQVELILHRTDVELVEDEVQEIENKRTSLLK